MHLRRDLQSLGVLALWRFNDDSDWPIGRLKSIPTKAFNGFVHVVPSPERQLSTYCNTSARKYRLVASTPNASLNMTRLGFSALESVPFRSIYIRVKPTPVSLSERHSVLRALQRYGEIEVFKKQHVSPPLRSCYWSLDSPL